ncbi:MAG: AccI family restriction endonuclease, partial [Muribaculaceae bacterium]|nr:AccI family restriction endonuclease [Muribaculaceae bacterium]
MTEYREIIKEICSGIHTDIIDFSKPRTKASMPTQASSEFITNKQQGDWAEDVIFRAMNNNSDKVIAVRYGKSEDLVAGDNGFKEFFNEYQEELDTIGKRPDILLFRKEDYIEELGHDISHLPSSEIEDYVGKAIAGIEVRSSAFLIDKYMEEVNDIVKRHTDNVLKQADILLSDYRDLLEDKCAALIPILDNLNSDTV